MALNIAFQMDPMDGLNLAGDSTFALMEEAQSRGHTLYHYLPDALTYEEGKVTAHAHPVTVRYEEGDHYTFGDPIRLDLAQDVDVIQMRQDPPFDMHYITITHLLELIADQTLVINNPVEVRNAPEKLFVTQYRDLMPATMITRHVGDIEAFRKKYGDIIVKPLYGMGGAGVFHLRPEDSNLHSLTELFFASSREQLIAQQFLPEVKYGDKRIILVDGEVAGAINRIPAEGEVRSNLAVGGRAAKTGLTDREREICERLKPELQRRGLLFVGIDVIGDYLTEINVTSPTGLMGIKDFEGVNVAGMIWDAVESKV
ncbi:glutathione synthase [Temperatibacter marinus]|uniref:Glutathione synthetase n=1 Tax=Temperatibacter marinus TaxID=1456591 RepID=A0AA52EJZ0_9PROT|nr:glutathione synthase [Temperatibacter marinus]WND03644.1 glutathione synthase [Temperatibacter marinus]